MGADRFPEAFEPAPARGISPTTDECRSSHASRTGDHRRADATVDAMSGFCLRDWVMAAKQPELCDFCKHRSPPVPLIAAGERRQAFVQKVPLVAAQPP
jgi:hypothetical protein